MSQMATPGVYYSQKRDCGLQNIDQKFCKKLRKYSIFLVFMVKSKYLNSEKYLKKSAFNRERQDVLNSSPLRLLFSEKRLWLAKHWEIKYVKKLRKYSIYLIMYGQI